MEQLSSKVAGYCFCGIAGPLFIACAGAIYHVYSEVEGTSPQTGQRPRLFRLRRTRGQFCVY